VKNNNTSNINPSNDLEGFFILKTYKYLSFRLFSALFYTNQRFFYAFFWAVT